MKVNAYLEVVMEIAPENRPAAAKVYHDYRAPFLDEIPGALTKELLIRDEDVQVIHGFDSAEHARGYLDSVHTKGRSGVKASLGRRSRRAHLHSGVRRHPQIRIATECFCKNTAQENGRRGRKSRRPFSFFSFRPCRAGGGTPQRFVRSRFALFHVEHFSLFQYSQR